MKYIWLGLPISLAFTACGGQVKLTSTVALRHAHEAAIQRQASLLQAKEVRLADRLDADGGVLMLQLTGIQNQPTQGDTLRQRVRKLAHLVATDLAEPDSYEAMTVSVSERAGVFKSDVDLPTLIYPLASLR